MADKKKAHHQDQDAHKDQAPTAGPSWDDRGPVENLDPAAGASAAQLKHDLHARILKYEGDGLHNKITIGMGAKHGVTEGMSGYVASKGGQAVTDFVVEHVDATTCTAHVNVPQETLKIDGDVVLNPSVIPGKPDKAVDVNARIIKVGVAGEFAEITIASGRLQGIEDGMRGVVVNKGGRRIAHFDVSHVEARTCLAYVKVTLDELHDCNVILNPADASVDPHAKAAGAAAPAGTHAPAAP